VHRYPREALEDFRTRPGDFDLILTDFSMPEMSGPALARALLEVRPGLPIVMMSGYLRQEDVAEAERSGIREVVLKPDVPEKLGGVIYRLLPARRSNPESPAPG
jgi:CheY-like chemotaxis protein